MSEWQLYHFPDLRHLFSCTTNVVISDLVERLFNLFSFNRFAFRVNDGVGRDDAVWRGVRVHHFELDGAHRTLAHEQIALHHWTVRLGEIGLDKDTNCANLLFALTALLGNLRSDLSNFEEILNEFLGDYI